MSYLKEHDIHVDANGGWSAYYLTLHSYLGEIEIHSCDSCSYLEVKCTHKYNDWHNKGTILTCNLCGVDGT